MKESAVKFRQNGDFYTENKQTGQLVFSLFWLLLANKQKKKLNDPDIKVSKFYR